MLKNLQVVNYAIIRYLNIEMHQGLSIITGETGAGKSIVLGALGLIMGNRADTNVLLEHDKKCTVEGLFDISAYRLQNFFTENDLDYDPETLIRREIMPSGKSRAFINDTPVNLSTLQQLTTQLIDIHSQHNNLLLNKQKFQLHITDTVADNNQLLEQYRNVYKEYRDVETRLNQLKETERNNKADYDYLKFQYDELDKAKLTENEEQELETEHERLSHTEEIKEALANSSFLLNNDDNSINVQLSRLHTEINKIHAFFNELKEIPDRLSSVLIETRDIASELELMLDKTEYDPERLQWVANRLELIHTLKHKHGKVNYDELLSLKNELSEKLLEIDSYDDTIAALQKQFNNLQHALIKCAQQLTKSRKQAAETIQQHVMIMLSDLAMPNSQLSVIIEETTQFNIDGNNHVSFMFSANGGGRLVELSKAASGGEMSRVMLSIKSLLTNTSGLPTIIFDEIDTGVSGEVAHKVGSIIKSMSENMQVINITHLPQVASKGQQHYKVYKTNNNGTSETQVKLLTDKERVSEIAQMLSGEQVTEAALENARQLLKNN